MVGGCFRNFRFTLPSQPHPAPRVVHLNTPHFLSPPQNRLLHDTAAFVLLPFYIGALVHRSASTSSMTSYAALEPAHRPRRTRSLFPGTVFHGLGSASRKPAPSAEAPPSWTMNLLPLPTMTHRGRRDHRSPPRLAMCVLNHLAVHVQFQFCSYLPFKFPGCYCSRKSNWL